jgi:transposase
MEMPTSHQRRADHLPLEVEMQVIVERGCGLDVGEAMVVACLLVGEAGQRPRKVIRTFRTFTRELRELRDWLLSEGCTHVAMESTGIYWVPVYAVLEGHFEVVVGNACHIKAVPGRKTDVKDAEWIANLLRHGLIAKSFVPPPAMRELRELLRYRRKVVEGRSAERNRVLRLLESANIKLASVATDVFGRSGMLMLRALLDGRTPLTRLPSSPRVGCGARFRRWSSRWKVPSRTTTASSLTSSCSGWSNWTLRWLFSKTASQHARSLLLKGIPGVDEIVAITIIAEIGIDMTVFRGASQLAAWSGVCPGNHESAGKRRNVRVRKGNPHLKPVLIQAAAAAARTRGTYLRSKFLRLSARRGYKRAVMAIAHKILLAAYRVLGGMTPYLELGEAWITMPRSGSRRTWLSAWKAWDMPSN